jgi:hypothetical protein
MLEGIFDAIHAERKMSLTHWRYRLLHWVFNVDSDQVWKDDSGKFHSKLPNYLYSHYCPLFHLTNLIALFSPIILVVKIVWAIIIISGIVCKKIFHGVKKAFAAAKALKPAPTPEENDSLLKEYKERMAQQELRSIPGMLAKYSKDSMFYLEDFDTFYRRITRGSDDDPYNTFSILNRILYASKEDIKKIWEDCVPKVKAAMEAHKQQQ